MYSRYITLLNQNNWFQGYSLCRYNDYKNVYVTHLRCTHNICVFHLIPTYLFAVIRILYSISISIIGKPIFHALIIHITYIIDL